MTPEEDRRLSRQARVVSIVIAVTMVLWLGAQWLGREIGLAGRYAILFDLMALAAFFWALVVIFRIWRRRREN